MSDDSARLVDALGDASAFLEDSAEDLYEEAPCGYLSTLPDGTIVKVNRTFEAWTGHTRAKLIGARFQDLLTPGGRIYHETHYRPLLQMQDAVREIALDVVCANGDRLPVLVNSALRRDSAGQARIIRTTVFNATDRRAYERELVEARKRSEQLYERERAVALALQRAMLPGALPDDPRCTLGTHYAPAVDTLEVGGDWFDAFAIGEDCMAMVVGDVVGKGLDAAATMGQLRSALRALMLSGLGGDAVLEHLDEFVEQLPLAHGATVAITRLNLLDGTLHMACAGHPPPVVLPPDGDPVLVWEGRSAPLGAYVRSGARREVSFPVERGTRVLLYTDGLVERRDRPIDTGIDRLMEAFARRRDESLATLGASLDRELVAEQHSADDVCMLAFMFAAPRRFERALDADPTQLSPLRADLRDWLASHNVGDEDRDAVILACSEVAANAMEHGLRDGAGTVRVLAEASETSLCVDIHDDGSWRDPPSETTRGRGLTIVDHLMDEVSVTRDGGTTVHMCRTRRSPT